VTDPEQRLARFGQRDHVRVYGRDSKTDFARQASMSKIWRVSKLSR
jgi:hypothetical protein